MKRAREMDECMTGGKQRKQLKTVNFVRVHHNSIDLQILHRARLRDCGHV